MKTSIRYSLIAGAVAVAGIGAAGAAMQKPATQKPAAMPQQVAHRAPAQSHGRRGARFLADYDLNRDGKVTRDEFDKTTAKQFAEASGGAKTMTEAQYARFRTRTLSRNAERSFRRADWNRDGKLSFEEFAGPIHASFERADRQSAGAISCRQTAAQSSASGHQRRGGAGKFCSRDDLNHDGKVTRAELDTALRQQFSAAAKGDALTLERFSAMQNSRAHNTSTRTFRRLDKDHDGKLTLAEFKTQQQRTFERMDRNRDGVIAQDEMGSRRSYSRAKSARRD